MWGQFLISLGAAVVLLWLPGWFIAGALSVSKVFRIALSPVISVTLYVILATGLSLLKIQGSWITIVVPSIIASVFIYLFKVNFGRRTERQRDVVYSMFPVIEKPKWMWATAISYVIFNIAVALVIFLKNLDGAQSYVQLYDNAWHLGIIRKFFESGDYSIIHSGDIVATQGSTFYPTGYHTVVALVMSLTNVPITVASNAVIFASISVVFPLSVFALITVIFKENYLALIAGIVVPLMFQAFPWRFITFGPLWSNLLATAVSPAILAILIIFFDADTVPRVRINASIYALVAFVFAAVTQPNTLFTLGVLIFPFIFMQIPQYLSKTSSKRENRLLLSICAYTVLIISSVAAWLFAFNASFMQRTVTWNWDKIGNVYQVIADVWSLGFSGSESQITLSVLLIMGIIITFIKRKFIWISVSYIIFCVFYMFSAGTEGTPKHILTGFWYTDYHRLAASAVLIALPLVVLGLEAAVRIAFVAYKEVTGSHVINDKRILSVSVLLALAFNIFMPYMPRTADNQGYSAFGAIIRDIKYWNASNESKSYSAEEEQFVQLVKQKVPRGSLIVNNPYDGSAYAWGVDALNVYYKAWQGNWMGRPTRESNLIMEHLNEISTNAEVCKAVGDVRAEYVIQLDKSDYQSAQDNPDKMGSMYAYYSARSWRGIDNISSNTPGFTLIMNNNGMSLYRIDSCTKVVN